MSKSKQPRRKPTPAEKLRVVLKGMGPGMDVASLCRQEGLSPTHYYAWKKQLLSSLPCERHPPKVSDDGSVVEGPDSRYRAANFSDDSSKENDENMLIIRGDQ